MSDDEMKRLFTKLTQKSLDRGAIPGLMGRVNSDGTVTIDVSNKPGWVHVRKGPDGKQGNTIAFNAGAPRTASAPIKMRVINNILTVEGIDGQRGIVYGGGGLPGTVGPHTHRIGSGYEYELEMLRLEAGRVRPSSGMIVTINPFRYQKSDESWDYWPGGTVDLTSNKPATAGNHAWVLVGVDTTDNTATATTGTEYSYSTPLTPDLLDDITFTDKIPCGAVRVRADDTGLVNISRYIDAHGWFNPGGGGSGSSTFLALTDTPSAFTSQAHKYVQVNSGATALEFQDPLVINVKDYGATGDGSTDDTSAIGDAITAVPATGGILYFPPGTYVTSGGFTLSKPITVAGAGGNTEYNDTSHAISRITCTSATAVLFTVSQYGCNFRDLAMENTAGSTPTAGAGIQVTAGGDLMHFTNLYIDGFWICMDVQDGWSWTMDGCWIYNPVKYGLKMQHVDLPDGGNQAIVNSYFMVVASVSSNTPDAMIRIESGGGMKITNVKINGANQAARGIDVTPSANTSVFLFSNSSIEHTTGNGIIFTMGSSIRWHDIIISGIQFGMYDIGSGARAILINADSTVNTEAVVIIGCTFHATGGNNADEAVRLINVDGAHLSGNVIRDGFTSLLTTTTCTDITEAGSNKVKVSSNDTTGDYLTNKVVVTEGVQKSDLNDGSDEDLQLKLDVSGLTAEATPDDSADYAVIYDASASAHRKVLLSNWPGTGESGEILLDDASPRAMLYDDEGDLIYEG